MLIHVKPCSKSYPGNKKFRMDTATKNYWRLNAQRESAALANLGLEPSKYRRTNHPGNMPTLRLRTATKQHACRRTLNDVTCTPSLLVDVLST